VAEAKWWLVMLAREENTSESRPGLAPISCRCRPKEWWCSRSGRRCVESVTSDTVEGGLAQGPEW
jgi:hypothetical protein